MKTKELALGGLLSAITLLIALVFGGILTISIPPFTATLMLHAPLFLAMLISPEVAAMVGLASALGFAVKFPVVVVVRALMHTIVGYVGGKIIKKGHSLPTAMAWTMPLHAVLEVIAVIPFFGLNIHKIFIVVALGTALHHTVDSVIAAVLAKALKMSGSLKLETEKRL